MKRPISSIPYSIRWIVMASLMMTSLTFFLLASRAETTSGVGEATLASEIALITPEPNIQPGTPLRFVARVTNQGTAPSKPGSYFIRFSFDAPLDSHEQSTLFETERVTLPSIEPHQSQEITFAAAHHWPPLNEYLRDDWAMRRYHAIFEADETEFVTGNLAVSFSAHYYAIPTGVVAAVVPLA